MRAGGGEVELAREAAVAHADAHPSERLAHDLACDLRAEAHERHAGFARALRRDRGGLGRERTGHERRAGLHDAGLLARDRSERRPELVGVLELDRGDAGDRGRDCVRRIQAASEADLEDRHVDVLLGEDHEGRRGRRVEEARRVLGPAQRVDRGANLRDRVGQAIAVDLAARDAEALRPALEVRRRERARAQSGFA